MLVTPAQAARIDATNAFFILVALPFDHGVVPRGAGRPSSLRQSFHEVGCGIKVVGNPHAGFANDAVRLVIAASVGSLLLLVRSVSAARQDRVAAPPAPLGSPEPVIIPVVVHVVLDSQRTGLVPPALVFSQIDALNRDFGWAIDLDHIRDVVCDHGSVKPCPLADRAGAPGIVFRLARRAPDGNETTGITYTATSIFDWDMHDPDAPVQKTSRGGADGWPSDKYFNIWVADLRPDPNSGESEGHAWTEDDESAQDGIIVDYRAFGDFSESGLTEQIALPFVGRELGRTATHETGHWLGLLHLCGRDVGSCDPTGDGIDDTPPQSALNGYCTPTTDSCPGDDLPDLCNDFMDCAADSRRVLFTRGQVALMRITLVSKLCQLLGTSSHIAAVEGADPWIAESWDDDGDEPYDGHEPVGHSPDVWLSRPSDFRPRPDDQPPGSVPNAIEVCVRVRNRGRVASRPGALALLVSPLQFQESPLYPLGADASSFSSQPNLVAAIATPSIDPDSASIVHLALTLPYTVGDFGVADAQGSRWILAASLIGNGIGNDSIAGDASSRLEDIASKTNDVACFIFRLDFD